MRNKQFLNEVKSLSTDEYTRPAKLTLKIAPADELIGVEPTEIVIESEDRRFLQELMIEAEICEKTGEQPTKIAKLLKDGYFYDPHPKKTENGGLIYTVDTPVTLNLADQLPAITAAFQNFQDELKEYVPDISELMSDHFTDEQKYLLRVERAILSWIALGLFHRIFGAIPDLLSEDDSLFHEHKLKTHIQDVINIKSAEFQLLTTGEKYIRAFAEKHNRVYPFTRPLDLFMKIYREGIEQIVASIMHGEEKYESKKEVNKARARFKKFIKDDLDQKDMKTFHNTLFNEGWFGLVALSLAPLYHSNKETHFRKLWDVYLDAIETKARNEVKHPMTVVDSTGNLYAVKPHNKRQKLKIHWETDRLLPDTKL